MGKIGSQVRVVFWFVSGLFKRYFKIILFSSLVSILTFLLVKSIFPSIKPLINPKTERIAIVGFYNPSNLPLAIQSLISSGLTSVTLEGSASAGLAESWQVSPNGKIYRFFLKRGIKWHDQTELTALDVNYNLKDAIIIPINDYELEVRLKEPYVPLPVLLSKPLFKKGLIGVGPYRVKSLKLKGEVIEKLELVPFSTKLPKKVFRFYADEEKAILGFKLGEVDLINQISDPKELTSWPNVEISQSVLLNRYVGLFFNTQNDYLKEKEVRQALSQATPSFFGEKPVGSISPLSWAYYPKVKTYEQNLTLAQKKLNQTPLATSSAKIVISTFQNLLPISNKIVEEWAKAGIRAEVKVENTIPSEFEVLLATQEIPPDPDQYPLWHSTQTATNLTRLTNPKIDKLLEDGRTINDGEERLKIYADFQRFIAEESPVAFLYYPKVYSLKRKELLK